MSKPILCLDFDGVLHAYSKGWHDGTVYDGPVPGAIDFIKDAVQRFSVVVYSSRSKTDDGIRAMKDALIDWIRDGIGGDDGFAVFRSLTFAHEKPAAFLTIDDRALTFTGTFPPVDDLLAFKPWNQRDTTI